MVYVISDIHGEYDLFIKLLQKINFSTADTLFICGDIIEKGQDSVKLLQFVKSMPNFRCILGNHEYAFLKYYWTIMQSSPENFDEVLKRLQAYFPQDGALLDWETMDWLESLPPYLEEQDFVCVHAGVPLDDHNRPIPLSQATVEQLVHDRTFKEPNVEPKTNKCIFFGHTPTSYISNERKILTYKWKDSQEGTIRDFYKIHLDLGVWLDGVMGCFCVDTCQEHYVSKWDN